MGKGWRILEIATLLLATGFVAPGQAEACACGAFVAADSRLTAVEETALIEVDSLAPGRTSQTVVLNLGLRSEASVTDAAFVMPVPGPAQFSLAGPTLFTALDEMSKPKVQYDVEHHFALTLPFLMGGVPRAGSAPGVVVENRVTLGPYDVVALTGSEASAVRDWLHVHGFELSAELGEGLTEYLAKGWQIVAVKLTSADGLQGVLPPMRITYESDGVVYPMRLSAHAKSQQQLRVYVLADHRASITNPTPDSAAPEETFAGWVRSEDVPPLQTEFSGQRFLTRYDQEFHPAANAADIRVAAAPDDAPFRAVVHVVDREPWPWSGALCCGLFLVLPLAAALGAAARSKRRRANAVS
ncbi:DUF2330 domain-containing protein [Segniliparus rugosus]|uniref:DUF2330 domain-containing protein n=1 Tax=Segniliparus rugosus (strain ATCC BAA-974 / DSM 45345 / CCUG 50838 / CIP 108380 / JCM 13579 / CDC 945) TaxID=679197 RepID=E5XSS4_SEGRC|nr:DUF2330 domain-containing protein [Segniliparus rugosus]EFV12601.1 hypothetical protein HMPREF9336_02546 [Segniliparus rugosus ATCC BAA-974]